MFKNILLITTLSFGLSACITLQRSEQSGFRSNSEVNYNTPKEYYNSKLNLEVSEAKEQLSIPTTRPLTEEEKLIVHNRIQLNRLEEGLHTPEAKLQYYQLKPYFKNDAERIHFLKIPNVLARKRWANRKNLTSQETNHSEEVLEAIESNDIIAGMTKTAVRESWGDPDFIEVAGNSIYNNERWNYLKQTTSPEGYKKERRIIVFEAGRVAGWEVY